MRNLLLASAALGALALGGAFASANAAPALGSGLSVSRDGSGLDKVWWRRVCDHHGNNCHRVWVRDNDDGDHRGWRWRSWNRDHHDHDRR